MSHRLTYAQYLQRIQRRASVNAKRTFRKSLRRRHLRAEIIGIALLIAALITFLAGLRISTVMCLVLAVPVLTVELWHSWLERRMGFGGPDADLEEKSGTSVPR